MARNISVKIKQIWARIRISGDEGEPSFPRLRNAALVKAKLRPRLARVADKQLKENKTIKCMATLSDSRSDWQCMQNMNERFIRQSNMHVCEAVCRLGERLCKTVSCLQQQWDSNAETKLGQANIYVNDNKHSKKSSKQYSHKRKHKKRQKCSTRHGKQAYPKTTELNAPTAPRCDVGCQRCKADVRNELCNVQMMSFDNIEVVTRMPRI